MSTDSQTPEIPDEGGSRAPSGPGEEVQNVSGDTSRSLRSTLGGVFEDEAVEEAYQTFKNAAPQDRESSLQYSVDIGVLTPEAAQQCRDRLQGEEAPAAPSEPAPAEAVPIFAPEEPDTGATAEMDASGEASTDNPVEEETVEEPVAIRRQTKWWEHPLQSYRALKARLRKPGRSVDRGVRATATAAGSGGILSVTNLQFFQNALNVGGWIAAPLANVVGIGAPAASLLYRPLRGMYARRKYGDQLAAQAQECHRLLGMNRQMAEEHEAAFAQELQQRTVELIDQPGEQELIQALHHVLRAELETIPHFFSEELYARYCFRRITDACRAAAERPENTRTPDQRVLARYYPLGADGRPVADAADRISHLRQVAIAYGKMLAERERKNDEPYTTGGIIGASATLALTYGPLAPLVGGAAWAGRKLWRRKKEGEVHIEIDDDRREVVGKGGHPIYSPTAHRSDVLSLYRGGDYVTQAEDEATRKAWREEEGVKTWLKRITIPAEAVQRCRSGRITSVQMLASETAPVVQEQLRSLGIKPKSAVNQARVRQLELDEQAEKEQLANLRTQRGVTQAALESSANQLREIRRQLAEAKNPSPRENPMTVEEIGRDEDACKAFAIKVVETFQANFRKGAMRAAAGKVLAPVGASVKNFTAEVIVKPVVGATAAGALAAGGSYVAGTLLSSAGFGFLATPVGWGGAGFIFTSLGLYTLVMRGMQNLKKGSDKKD